MSTAAPLHHKLVASPDEVATAGNTETTILGEAPWAGVVTDVTYTPEANITGAATNHRRFRIVNRGQAGAGSTVIAELAMDSGVNATAGDERAIALSGTAANLVVAAGDILAWESAAINTGITDPGGLVQVTLSRTAGS